MGVLDFLTEFDGGAFLTDNCMNIGATDYVLREVFVYRTPQTEFNLGNWDRLKIFIR